MGGPHGAVRDAIGRLVFRRIYEQPLLPRLNEVRAELGLRGVSSLAELLTGAERVLVLTSRAFDFGGRLPANVRYLGVQLDEPTWTEPWESPWAADDDRRLVVVGLSTTYQAHAPLLERVVAALGSLPIRALVSTGSLDIREAPPNVHLAPHVPHARVLQHADLVVTHAGLGTVHAALAHGLPLVCLPIGRDQPDNAARVAWHRAGVRLRPQSSSARIAAAIERVLADQRMATAARRLAAAIADEHHAERGVAELERLAAGGQAELGVPALARVPSGEGVEFA